MATNPQRCVAFLPGAPVTLKAFRKKDYSEAPKTLGEHLKKRRRELGLLQRKAAARLGILKETYANREKGKTGPVAPQFRVVVALLGYDPMLAPQSLKERLEARRRALGMTFSQAARHLEWDPGSLKRYLDGTWRISPDRLNVLEAFLIGEDTALGGLHSLLRRN